MAARAVHSWAREPAATWRCAYGMHAAYSSAACGGHTHPSSVLCCLAGPAQQATILGLVETAAGLLKALRCSADPCPSVPQLQV